MHNPLTITSGPLLEMPGHRDGNVIGNVPLTQPASRGRCWSTGIICTRRTKYLPAVQANVDALIRSLNELETSSDKCMLLNRSVVHTLHVRGARRCSTVMIDVSVFTDRLIFFDGDRSPVIDPQVYRSS